MLKSSMKIVAACERSRCVLSIARNSVRAASNTSSSLSGSKDKTNQQQQSEIIRPEFGLMFDIDGVLVRGKTLLPQTKNCIRLITDEHGNFRVPTVFVTNAGNELRSTKAAKLSNFLGVYIDPNQVVMSHSPLKLFKQYHNMRCLVSGQGPIVEIAKNLGFKSLITIDDLRQHYPHLDVVDHKRRNFAPCALGRYFPPIEAIVLFGESIRWETNLQLIIDVLMSSGKLDHSTPLPSLTNLIMSAQTPPIGGGEHQNTFPVEQLPILACNADMVWMAEAAMPRFGHGVFLHCLEQIYAKLSGRELKYQCIVGKPNEITYYYAEQMVQRHAASIGLTNKVRRLYAVGDNLDTDIYGANVYNQILENNRRSREKKQFQQQKQQQQQEAEQEHHQQQAILSGSSSSYATTSQSSSKSSSKSYDMSEQESAVSQQRRYSTSSSGNGNNSSTSEHHHRYMDSRDVVTSHVSDAESIRSILVRTGVFRGAADSTPTADSSLAHKDMLIDQSLMKPSYISDNVFEAVKLVYELENFS